MSSIEFQRVVQRNRVIILFIHEGSNAVGKAFPSINFIAIKEAGFEQVVGIVHGNDDDATIRIFKTCG